MRSTLKTAEALDIEKQIQDFFSRGKTIEVVPSNVYKREEITLRDKRTILETSNNKVKR